MENEGRTYCCIDLKSFYASVECTDRGWDPLEKRLVVADPARGPKTICLAVSPALKRLGVPGRCRVFEIPDGIDYVMARPRMTRYMERSADILRVYLRYVSAQDMHVYSIDECFIDLTPYVGLYGKTGRDLAKMLIQAVLDETGITATAGVGPNLFLAKVALDVTAKHAPDNIGELDEVSFRERIWSHRPITDIWQIGRGIAARLEKHGIRDMGGVAHADIDMLYREFGANAEYLIDHAWGIEPCTIAEVRAYEPQATSIGSGQVLPDDYSFEEGRMILREMVEEIALDLIDKHAVCGHVSVYVGYAKEDGIAGHAGASKKLDMLTSSFQRLLEVMDALFCETVDPARLIKRINLACGALQPEECATYDLFTDVEAEEGERTRQEAMLAIKHRFGKDAVMRGTSLKERARGRERAHQVGGHAAGDEGAVEDLRDDPAGTVTGMRGARVVTEAKTAEAKAIEAKASA